MESWRQGLHFSVYVNREIHSCFVERAAAIECALRIQARHPIAQVEVRDDGGSIIWTRAWLAA